MHLEGKRKLSRLKEKRRETVIEKWKKGKAVLKMARGKTAWWKTARGKTARRNGQDHNRRGVNHQLEKW